MGVSLRDCGFMPYQELEAFQQAHLAAGSVGAAVSFVGTMRDFNDGDSALEMTLEHYPGMTERRLEDILRDVAERWNVLDALVIHRVGRVVPGDSIVLVAVWSSHRGTAFDACREIIERLKSEAPFWKKERLESRERWVERNTDGY
jgi:molybdopterin synthase catalytic subunit